MKQSTYFYLLRRGVIGGGGGAAASLLLDTYTGAAAAYSLRLLRTAYSGNAIRVRRESDNEEQDIPFRAGAGGKILDTTTLESFCSGTDGFVTTWYDQSGNANNASQTTAASQPKIVSSGTTIALNGKPSINGDAVEDSFELGTSVGLSSGYSIFQVNQVPSANTYAVTMSSVSTTNASGIFIFDSLLRFRVDGTTYNNYGASGNKGSQNLWGNFVDSSNNLDSYLNSSVYGSSVSSVTGTFDFEKIGTNLGVNSFEYFQELIVYNSDQSSNRSGIETNINDFYSIY